MRRKVLAWILMLSLILSMMPLTALAAVSVDTSRDYWDDHCSVSIKEYSIAPDIVEYEWIVNNNALSGQQVGHVMEVQLGQNANIIAGYNNYLNADNTVEWGMKQTTQQAQAAEDARGVNVVGAVNGDFYNMSNGSPSGALVMDGNVIKTATSNTFWIDKNDVPHITAGSEVDWDNVKEAVSGGVFLVKDGEMADGLESTYGDTANPRTVVGLKPDNTVVIYMVDGRQAPYSVGMVYAELAEMMLALGCDVAINLDGGGSSTFATQREGEYGAVYENNGQAGLTIRCRPSDGRERTVSNTLLVVSNAAKTGIFDHANITPAQEVYTPGSTIQFTATGVDAGGYATDLPADLTWHVDSSYGTIDGDGTFQAAQGVTGTVTISVQSGGRQVGSTTVDLQWPDQLGFTNTSISLDFGESSDLSFYPTYEGREVHYKDGDFVWDISEENLNFRFSTPVEKYYYPQWMASSLNKWIQMQLMLTGAIGETKTITDGSDTVTYYETRYEETSLEVVNEDGQMIAREVVTHLGATSSSNSGVIHENIREDTTTSPSGGTANDGAAGDVIGLSALFPAPDYTHTYDIALGSFSNNEFTADADNSLRGQVTVALASDPDVTGSVDVIVGMEPHVLIDFEDHGETPAEEYWTYLFGPSEDHASISNGWDYLSKQEIEDNLLWYRLINGTNGNNVETLNRAQTGLISDPEFAKYGDHAFQLGFDFQNGPVGNAYATCFGFSGDLLLDDVQPTKLGVWVYVPDMGSDEANATAYGNTILKAFAKAYNNTTRYEDTTSYLVMDEDGGYSKGGDGELLGTATYMQYYYNVYDDSGNVVETQEFLRDWAGKGWIWVEADISGMQMPIDLSRAYSVRIVSPTISDGSDRSNGYEGYIYIDNLQLIYGSNTDDVINPVVGEPSIQTGEGEPYIWTSAADVPVIDTNSANLEFTYSDAVGPDQAKYNTGIDTSRVSVTLDGATDLTGSSTINPGNVLIPVSGLNNGLHQVTITVWDNAGNQTSMTRSFRVDMESGLEAAVVVQSGDTAVVGGTYAIQFVNSAAAVSSATFGVRLPAAYQNAYSVTAGTGYQLNGEPSYNSQTNTLTFSITANGELVDKSLVATVSLDIPDDAAEGDTLLYAVPSGSYELNGQTGTFSDQGKTVELSAAYTLSYFTGDLAFAVQGFATTFQVKDSASGAPVSGVTVYADGASIGQTDDNGEVTSDPWDTAKTMEVYAEKDGNRSWSATVVVHAQGAPLTGTQNTVPIDGNGATGQVITWTSAVGSSLENGTSSLTISKDAGFASSSTVSGTSEVTAFTYGSSGNLLRVNNVELTGLEPETRYYYKVDGSDTVYSFTTCADGADSETSFFVMADTQGNYGEGTTLSSAIGKITDGTVSYDFGIHTGDAIDNPNVFSNWTEYWGTINNQTLNIPIAHALGNHEYGEATGKLAGRLFGMTGDSYEGGALYTVEYGNVFVAVINDSLQGPTALYDALDELAARAQQSSCAWKVLAMHKPVFGTEGLMAEAAMDVFLSKIQAAGIDVVFTGDNHAYARTYPIVYEDGTISKMDESSREGVVYYVCGDLSAKSNEFNNSEYFAEAIAHVDYTDGDADGAFLSVSATSSTLTITAYDQNGNMLDTYTESRSACETGNHVYDSSSVYDMEKGTITCSVCGAEMSAVENGYTGLLATTDGKQVILTSGVPKTDDFTLFGSQAYHSGADGYAHPATMTDNRGCLTGGYITYGCEICGVSDTMGDYQMPAGHTWAIDPDTDDYALNENGHRTCSVCGAEGYDIADAIVDFGTVDDPRGSSTIPRYTYLAGGVRPSSFVSFDGKTALTSSNDNTLIDGKMRDVYVSWLNSTTIGAATIRYEGRGNYYGTRELTYYIVPDGVHNLTASAVGKDTVTLKWDAVPQAEYYEVYSCDANNSTRTWQAKTEGTSCVISGLEENQTYYFVVAGRTYGLDENGEQMLFTSGYWSNILSATTIDATKLSETYVQSIAATVDGTKLLSQKVDGTTYLFLPSTADLANLPLNVTVEGHDGAVTVGGSNGSVALDGDTAVDLTTVADANGDGTYTLSVAVGDLKPMTVQVVKSANVGVMYLTSGSEEHDREYVDASKSNEVSDAAMQLVRADGTVVYDSGLKELKARGNSTFTYAEKKSYQIKLSGATDLLGNGEEVKTWVLLAGYFDATQMHDKLFKDLAAELEMPFTPSSDWIDLFYDGEYRGTYLLSEKVSVNDTSVDITDMEKSYEDLNSAYGEDPVISTGTNAYGQEFLYTEDLIDPENITGGYLIELNDDGIDEASGFNTTREQTFNVKSPEWASQAAMAYISEYYQAFEDAVYATDANGNYTGYNEGTGKYYYEYCDMDSLVQAFVLQELSLNPDGFRSSLFFYKDVDGIMYAGPVWDMEMTLGSGWEKYISTDVQDYHYLAEALIKIPEFKAAVTEYLRDTFLPEVDNLLGSNGKIASYKEQIADSAAMNYVLWPYVRVGSPATEDHLWAAGTTYDDVVADMSQWLQERVDVLEETFGLSSGSGSGSGSGSISVPSNAVKIESPSNGTVKVSPANAAEGKTVTLTVTPDNGYVLKNITVTDANGNIVTVEKKSDSQYTFTMPATAVNVTATFIQESLADGLPFTDVGTSDWYYDAVEYAYGNGMMNGTSATRFAPQSNLTRAMIAQVLYNLEKTPGAVSSAFADVASGAWYADAVNWAAENEIVNGFGNGTFGPEKNITREQMAQILYNYAKFKGYDVSAKGQLSAFTDGGTVSNWAEEAMTWAVGAKLLNGKGNGRLDPTGTATRAEVAQIFMNFCENIAK